MGYKTIKELLQNSKNDGAVGAFNIHNMEFIKGVVKAAEEENRPAIMMINEAVLMYGGIDVLGGAAIAAAKNAKVDMAVMVDHGTHMDFLKRCIDFGLDVMYDGSALDFKDNIEKTKEMTEYAHEHGRALEGEIGALGLSEDGDEEREQKITSVKEAVTFSKETGVDVLAVSVGNVHGFYKGSPQINIKRIKEIHEAVSPLPIVMHGGSDIPYETIKASIEAGIRKFNIATDLKYTYAEKMRQLLNQNPMPIQPLQLFPVVADAVADTARKKIKMFHLEGEQI